MVTPLRASVLALMLVACDGQKFGTGGPEAGGSGNSAGGGGGGEASAGGAEAGGSGGAADPGEAGTPGASGNPAVGGEGLGGDGGGAGTSASEPVCDVPCGAGRECTATSAGSECRCGGGLVGDGDGCRLPRSCNELHGYAPQFPSGTYELQPKVAEKSFKAHCGMIQEGGGWTLVVNEGPTFDPTTNGAADVLGYATSGTNLGYSLVIVDSDVMLDVSNSPIAATTYAARLVVTGVHVNSRGKTLRTLFTTGPNYVEAENNGNLAVRLRDGADCASLPLDLAKIACQKCDTAGCKAPVMVFGDGDAEPGCRAGAVPHLAIGAATDYTTPWKNCAGWPQDPNYTGADFYPDYVRVWVR